MKRAERKIIFECRVGSHLYGTNRPESDEDFLGIFIPSQDDLLGLQNPPSEWSMDVKLSNGPRNAVGDVDRKYWSLQKFMNLAGQGQSGPIELLFSPENMWTIQTPEWCMIRRRRALFLSQNTILPFIGFATAQAHKACLKGDNLNLIRTTIAFLKTLHPHSTLGEAVTFNNGELIPMFVLEDKRELMPKYVITEGGEAAMEVAGRQYEFTQQIRYVLQKLKRMEGKYGTRSENAASYGFDYKSLTHAYRLLFQARELLETGHISLPRPPTEVELLRKIRAGMYEADFFEEIQEKMTDIRKITSSLPKTVDYSKIEQLCQRMMYTHLFGGETNEESET